MMLTRLGRHLCKNQKKFIISRADGLHSRLPKSLLLVEQMGLIPVYSIFCRADGEAGLEEKKWLAELLANERAVGPLLSYLKDTEVGSREGAAEVTKEWRQSDQEGKEQLGNS